MIALSGEKSHTTLVKNKGSVIKKVKNIISYCVWLCLLRHEIFKGVFSMSDEKIFEP
jgi:hypothetical protein